MASRLSLKHTTCTNLLLLNKYRTTAKCRRWIRSIGCAKLVVVDNGISVIPVPDLDPKLVHTTSTRDLTINGG